LLLFRHDVEPRGRTVAVKNRLEPATNTIHNNNNNAKAMAVIFSLSEISSQMYTATQVELPRAMHPPSVASRTSVIYLSSMHTIGAWCSRVTSLTILALWS
jgi:hypothetical protein